MLSPEATAVPSMVMSMSGGGGDGGGGVGGGVGGGGVGSSVGSSASLWKQGVRKMTTLWAVVPLAGGEMTLEEFMMLLPQMEEEDVRQVIASTDDPLLRNIAQSVLSRDQAQHQRRATETAAANLLEPS